MSNCRKTITLSLTTAAIALTISPAHARVVIDDFSSGTFSGTYNAAPLDTNTTNVQNGTMASGSRYWNLLLRGPDELGGLVDIGPAAGGFRFASNLGVGHRFDWIYGHSAHSQGMMLDLSDESRLRFAFREVPRGLNFNVLVYYRGELNNYSQLGVNILPSTTPTNVDFAFSDFAAVVADPTRPADFSKVSHIYIVTQSGAVFAGGGEGFVLSSIAAVPEPGEYALMLAGLGAVAWIARRRNRA